MREQFISKIIMFLSILGLVWLIVFQYQFVSAETLTSGPEMTSASSELDQLVAPACDDIRSKFVSVAFRPESDDISAQDQKILLSTARELNEKKTAKVFIIGRVKVMKDVKQDLQMGLRRAAAVRVRLENLGVSKRKLRIYAVPVNTGSKSAQNRCSTNSSDLVQITIDEGRN